MVPWMFAVNWPQTQVEATKARKQEKKTRNRADFDSTFSPPFKLNRISESAYLRKRLLSFAQKLKRYRNALSSNFTNPYYLQMLIPERMDKPGYMSNRVYFDQPRFCTCPIPSRRVISWFALTPLAKLRRPVGQKTSMSATLALPSPKWRRGSLQE